MHNKRGKYLLYYATRWDMMWEKERKRFIHAKRKEVVPFIDLGRKKMRLGRKCI
jgi:hypothetical protein